MIARKLAYILLPVTTALLLAGCPSRSPSPPLSPPPTAAPHGGGAVAPAPPGPLPGTVAATSGTLVPLPPPLPPGTIPPPVVSCQVSAANLMAAMVSVRLHVTVEDNVLSSGSVPVMPLEMATCVLKTADGRKAESRRARAIAMLGASSVADRAPAESGTQRFHRIIAALERLGMTPALLNNFRQRVATGPPSLSSFDLTDVDLHALRDHSWRIIKQDFAEDLDLVAGMACWDPLEPIVPPVQYDEESVTLATKVAAYLPLGQVRSHIDPQSWDSCSSSWQQARLMDWTAGGAVPETSPPATGGNHPTRNLFEEQFVCDEPCGFADFRLLLCTRTRCFDPTPSGTDCQLGGSKRFRVDYEIPHEPAGQCCPNDLCIPACSQGGADPWWLTRGKVGGVDVRPCIDDGWIEATLGGPSRTVVEGRKTLHFDPASLDDLTAAAYTEHWEELNDELGELACCLP